VRKEPALFAARISPIFSIDRTRAARFAEDIMSDDIYQQLRKAVASHSAYFQATPSGLEIAFLRKLFTEEEAEIYIHLTGRLETADRIAERAGQDPETVAAKLKGMAKKGLLFPKRKGETNYYAAASFAHGILEHQVHTIDKELAQIYEEYMWAEKLPEESDAAQPTEISLPLRSLPVKVPINISRPVAPYEDVKEIIKKQDRIALTKCFCAVQQQVLGSSCTQPLEVCMLLGFYAEYYIDQGMGRSISQQEALDVLARAEEAGLVHQIPDSQDPGAICNCCPDCCGELRMVKMLPNPAALIACSYFCELDPEACNGCEICVDRCSLGAISASGDQSVAINLDRCIGCGLCINTCPEEALTLVAKPEQEVKEPPPTSRFMRSSQDIESTLS
jgi:ferredoxin